MSKPLLLTPARSAAILKLMQSGAPAVVAAQAVGIHETTYYRWLKRGEDPDETDPRYAKFGEDITRARAEFETRALDVLARAAPKDSRNAQWALERVLPHRYGRTTKAEISGPGGTPLFTIPSLVEIHAVADGRATITDAGKVPFANLGAMMGIDDYDDDDLDDDGVPTPQAIDRRNHERFDTPEKAAARRATDGAKPATE